MDVLQQLLHQHKPAGGNCNYPVCLSLPFPPSRLARQEQRCPDQPGAFASNDSLCTGPQSSGTQGCKGSLHSSHKKGSQVHAFSRFRSSPFSNALLTPRCLSGRLPCTPAACCRAWSQAARQRSRHPESGVWTASPLSTGASWHGARPWCSGPGHLIGWTVRQVQRKGVIRCEEPWCTGSERSGRGWGQVQAQEGDRFRTPKP